jgi:ribosome-binding factor A
VREKLPVGVSVSDVEVTRDLAHAKVYVTALVGDQGKPAVKELKEAAWEFRASSRTAIDLRTVPALHFQYDDSVDRGERIEALLRVPVVPEPVAQPARPKAPRKAAAKSDAPAKKAPAKKRAPRKTAE